uniref:EAL domain-containing protein n=1 Tax=Pseudomaricurvus sp. TaxID=2004510 RepID=UPI003F6AC480
MTAEAFPSTRIHFSDEATEGLLYRMSDAYFLIGADRVIERANPAAHLLFDTPELVGLRLEHLVQQDVNWASVSSGDRFNLSARRHDGKQIKLNYYAPAGDGYHHCVISLVNPDQPYREQLLRQTSLVRAALCSITDAVISVDAKGVIETINPMARELLNLTNQTASGLPIGQVLVIADSVTHRVLPSPVLDVLKRGAINDFSEVFLYAVERKPVLISLQAIPLRNAASEVDGCLLIFRNSSQVDRDRLRVKWQARHDTLTSQLNRQAFEVSISQAMEKAQNEPVSFGLLYIDIYQFKVINDTCGHAGGDELLRQLAELIANKLRSQDMLARLGSDEFGVLIYNTTLAGAQRLASSVIDAVQNYEFHWGAQVYKVAVSIGVVVIDESSESEAQVLATANAASCAAKELGRNRIHWYNKDQEVEQRRSEINWVVNISQALAQNRFSLFQQKIQPMDGSEDHYEILLRLRQQNGELVNPDVFIPAAERYGLMDDVDRWVVDKVIGYLRERMELFLPPRVYTVNLSGMTISDPEFSNYVLSAIERSGIDATLLHFEITETAAIRHLDNAIEFMRRLRERGSRFYLDDFGSGLSSFAYLKELPVDYLKIDGSFVSTMLEDSASFAMVSTFNHLAHSMNLKTVAEYVETEELLDALIDIGVDFVQGF